jgi:hypothetical protein
MRNEEEEAIVERSKILPKKAMSEIIALESLEAICRIRRWGIWQMDRSSTRNFYAFTETHFPV